MVLHTWGQNLGQHIHVHCIVTDGGLSPDGQRWLTPARASCSPRPRSPRSSAASISTSSALRTVTASFACTAAATTATGSSV
ncbi:MAG: transposase [Chloroflexi bacterium]|nr:transposase [Chloroflexota bacterium]